MLIERHHFFMQKALELARQGGQEGEVPVGAIIVAQNRILAKANNQVEKLKDPTAHAEMLAITAACSAIGGKYLRGCTLYVTLEPCVMCAAALRWAQIKEIIFGAYDKKGGFTNVGAALLHPRTTFLGGVCEAECKLQLTQFFKAKRS
jgi:tRNA(adenine34) deaminase